ncbi:FtsX-like permease family protein [Clostridium sp.]|uniref:ABC transporter permease n=1 Tax=Clostridium sp. TaxID=1506 RepID=UPI001B75A840|nr:FtsX-like permease family protein [Clostridium sp.]MBP3917520.1 ABC transporter permease [Clostridium sp.]
MRSYSDITLKYLKKNKKRTLLTIIGIILSLSLISGVGFLGLSFKDYMYNSAIENNGDYEFTFLNVDKRVVNILKNDVDLEKVGIMTNEGSGSFKIDGYDEGKIYITSEDATCLNEIFIKNLTEGRVPKDNTEIIIDSQAKEFLGINLNDKVKLQEITYDKKGNQVLTNKFNEYVVVGFTKERFTSQRKDFNATTYLDEIKNNKSYDISFTVKDSKNKRNIALGKAKRLKLDENNMISNSDLLALRGQTEYDGINLVLNTMVIFVIGIIVLATIFLIYNAINISVTERINQFGILRSIGATPKQIRNLVIREGIVMCLISIPFGVLAGFIGVWTTVKILDTKIAQLLGSGMLSVKFYPSIILFTVIIGIITIFMASFGPARKAGKVSPISVIKGNSENEKIKYYKGRLIRKVFSVEGWMAYKNIRKNGKRFTVTILSLSISLIMFITFTTLNMKRIDELNYINKSSITHGTLYDNNNVGDQIEEKLKNIEGIEEVYRQSNAWIGFLAIDLNLISEQYKMHIGYGDEEFLEGVEIRGFDKNSLKEIGFEEGLKDNEVILVNNKAYYDEKGKLNNIDITNLKEGDTFKLPVSNFNYGSEENYKENLLKDKRENNCIEFKVKKIIDKNPFEEGYSNKFTIIMDYDNLNKIDNSIYLRDIIKFKYSDINDDKLTDDASELIQKIADDYGVTFSDLNADNKNQQQIWTVINVFVYGFIVMVTLIGVVNVVNTISLNILLKKKEFGTLGTIGMSKSQLSKMVLLEGILHGVFSSIVAGILSIPLVLLIIKIVSYGFTISNKIYWEPFVIGFAINLIVVLIASLIPLNKLKKMNLVETIRNVE